MGKMYLVLLFALWFEAWFPFLPQWPRFETLNLPQLSLRERESKNFLKLFGGGPRLPSPVWVFWPPLFTAPCHCPSRFPKFFQSLSLPPKALVPITGVNARDKHPFLPLKVDFKVFATILLLLWMLVLAVRWKYFLHLIAWTGSFSFLCLSFTICQMNQNL